MLGGDLEGDAVCIAPTGEVSPVWVVLEISKHTRTWRCLEGRRLDTRLWIQASALLWRPQCNLKKGCHHAPFGMQHGLGAFGRYLPETMKSYWIEQIQCLLPCAFQIIPPHPSHQRCQCLAPHAWLMLPRHRAERRHQYAHLLSPET